MTADSTSVSRVISGSAATWSRIVVKVITQIALVPLYLSSWTAEVYGAWLLIQAVWIVITLIDLSHHDYVGYECLRLGTANRHAIVKVIMSAFPVAVFIAFMDIMIVWWLGGADFISSWIGEDPLLLEQWHNALILQAVTWLLTGSFGGLIVRWLTPFGYWPLLAWWGVVNALMTSMAPAIAVVMGADLWGAMIVLCMTNIVYYLAYILVMTRILRNEGFVVVRPVVAQGLSQFLRSFWLAARSLAVMLRQQGVRIILAPLAGIADMAAFSTMRTGANFALQGLGTITGPVMPELMRYLVTRDQQRTESAFAIVWLVLCATISPAILIVQWAAPTLFPLWTHGKFFFDPWLFGMLSLTVSVFALAQPATAVLQGNNIVRSQLIIALIAAFIAIGGMVFLVPIIGVKGAALSLLLAEVVSVVATIYVADQWLKDNDMQWPWKAFLAVAASVFVTALGITVIITLPSSTSFVGLMGFLALQVIVVVIYWRSLPILARSRAGKLVNRYLPAYFHVG